MSKPTHVTRRDVLDDLGFSRSEASALKVKATILEAILSEIARRGFTQRQLVDLLDEYQPNVSNLLNGRIGRVSMEKLLGYADRLGMISDISIRAPRKRAVRAVEPERERRRAYAGD